MLGAVMVRYAPWLLVAGSHLLPRVVATAGPSVASVGSSYSYGYGLDKSYGEILAELLAGTHTVDYANYAMSGSNVTDVTTRQARMLDGKQWDVVVLTSGGNDLNYVGCLGTPTAKYCGHTIDSATYISRFTAALDAIFANVAEPTKTAVYVVGYTQALGIRPACSARTADCPLTPAQVGTAESIYNNLVSWTSWAVLSWQRQHTGKGYTVRHIPMNVYSANTHDFDSRVPWINGAISKASTDDGAGWHPNAAGAQFMAHAVYEDLSGARPYGSKS